MRLRSISMCGAAMLALAGCAASDDVAPTPTANRQSLEVPSEPSHPPYVPSTFFPAGTTGPGIWSGDQVPIVVAASIDGLGYPLPPGAAFEGWDELDPSIGFEIGTIESGVAMQWHCAWLAEWDAAEDAGDAALAEDVEELLEQFWVLPHIELLAHDDGTFREQQVAAAPDGADLNVWMLSNC